MDLIESIKSLPTNGEVIYNNIKGITEVYYSGQLIWKQYISFADELTCSGSARYVGDRLSSNCSASGSATGYNRYTDNNGHDLGSMASAGVQVTGRVNPGTNIITISYSGTGTTNSGNGTSFTGKIMNNSGETVMALKRGANDVSNYNDGSYYLYAKCSSQDYDVGGHTVTASISVSLSS